MASILLEAGIGSDLLDEIEETGRLDSHSDWEKKGYLASIGAILVKRDNKTKGHTVRYLRPTDRKQGSIPEGWERAAKWPP